MEDENMTYIPIIISETFIFLYWIINSGGKIMSDSTLNIILAAAAIIGPIITFILSRKSQISKNTEAIQRLARQLGVNDDITFHKEFTEQYETIIGNIGRGDKSTLTAQHDDLRNMLQKEIDVAERRYTEEEKRIRNFTAEQHNMAETIEDFKLFIESWQRLTSDMNDLNYQICRLEQENEELREKNKELKSQLCINSPQNGRKI